MADYSELFGESLVSQFESVSVEELRGKVIGIYFGYEHYFGLEIDG